MTTKGVTRTRSDMAAVAEGCYFEARAGDGVCRWIETFCHHSKDEWAGKPFVLLPWERSFVRELFGWRRKNGRRRFTRAMLFIPKKNGKLNLI